MHNFWDMKDGSEEQVRIHINDAEGCWQAEHEARSDSCTARAHVHSSSYSCFGLDACRCALQIADMVQFFKNVALLGSLLIFVSARSGPKFKLA